MEKKETLIPIVFVCEEENIKSLSVALVSLLENVDNNIKYDINIINNSSFSQESTDLIFSLRDKYNCEITFTFKNNIKKENISEIAKLITNSLNNIDKCIYLNHNVVVQKDLTELFNFNLNDSSIVGVKQIDDNINSNVLLIDCAKVRENDIKIGELDLKFNLQAYLLKGEKSFNFGKQVEIKGEFIAKFDKMQVKSALRDNVIFSYTDEVNPFNCGDCSFVDEWYKYFNLSQLTIKTDINTPLISVIVPVYNVEKYLQLCVDSITNQSYKNLEIILVDDGSTDNSGQMCYDLSKLDSRITVVHKSNGGLSSARNYGMEIAKGEYISFIDSDDFIHPRAYEIAVNCFDKNNDLDLVEWKAFASQEKDILNKELTDINFNKITEINTLIQNNNEFIKGTILRSPNSINVWSKLFKSELINGIKFENGKLNEDVFFTNKYMLKHKKSCLIDLPLHHYLIRSDSITHKTITDKNLDEFRAFVERYAILKEKYPQFLEIACRKDLAFFYARIKEISEQNQDNDYTLRKTLVDIVLYYYDDIIEFKGISQVIKDDFILAKDDVGCFIDKHDGKIKNPKIFLFLTPLHENLGDQAIVLAEKEFFSNKFPNHELIEIPQNYYLSNENEVKSKITKNDIIVVHGGGFIGTLWMSGQLALLKILFDFKNNKIVIFPQTTFFSDDKFGNEQLEIFKNKVNLCDDITLFTRDRNSYNLMIGNNVFSKDNCFLVPDIVTYLKPIENKYKRDGVIFCLRQDLEKIENQSIDKLEKYFKSLGIKIEYTDMCIGKAILPGNRDKFVNKKLKEFANYKLVVTDRLHGMIFSAISNTPCIAFDNISKKVSGVYDEWLYKLDYLKCISNDVNLSDNEIEKLVSIMDNEYVYDNKYLEEHFNIICQSVNQM